MKLDEVYATILYYPTHREQTDRYLSDWLNQSHLSAKVQDDHPDEAIRRLRLLREEHRKLYQAEPSETA